MPAALINLIALLQGKKTYITAAAVVFTTLASYLSGDMSLSDAMIKILEGVGLGTLRAGIAKTGQNS